MTVLRIEHAITDYTVWAQAFAGFAERRRHCGVRAERVLRPVDDPHYVLIDLDFDDPDDAARFRDFLIDQVWSNPQRSPALSGRPLTRIVEVAQIQAAAGQGVPAGTP